jgi:hypothetical protein
MNCTRLPRLPNRPATQRRSPATAAVSAPSTAGVEEILREMAFAYRLTVRVRESIERDEESTSQGARLPQTQP